MATKLSVVMVKLKWSVPHSLGENGGGIVDIGNVYRKNGLKKI